MAKTHITRPQKLKYPGFGFYKDSKSKEWKRRPHQDFIKKLKRRLKELTSRKIPGRVTGKIVKINQVTRGWINYYALGSLKMAMTEIDAHLGTRLRIIKRNRKHAAATILLWVMSITVFNVLRRCLFS